MKERQSFSLQWDKLAAAVAYLAERSRHDDAFGETKLVKLLYYADCDAYLIRGQPITGITYIHMERGPYPDGWQSLWQKLEKSGAIKVIDENIPGDCRKRRTVAGEKVSPEALTDSEITSLNNQLRRFADYNGEEIEEYSQDEVAWRVAPPGQALPHNLLGFRMPGPITDDVRERGNRIAERIRKYGRQPSRILVEREDAIPGR